jgi:hypothetical protein
MRTLNQKGEGKSGAFIGILILFVVVFAAFKVVPVMVRVYSFEDKVKEQCKFFRGSTDKLVEDIMDVASEEQIPIDEEDININYQKEKLKVNIQYTVPITFPGYIYRWNQTVDYDAPAFF